MRSLWMMLRARAVTKGDSVVSGDSCAEYVILHSDRCVLFWGEVRWMMSQTALDRGGARQKHLIKFE